MDARDFRARPAHVRHHGSRRRRRRAADPRRCQRSTQLAGRSGGSASFGADELCLEVDAERGTLLRIESRFEGQPFALSEVVEIAFDEQFPEDTFVVTRR